MRPCTERSHACIDTAMGPMVLAATPRGLAGAWFAGQRHFPGAAALGRRDDTHPVLQRAARQLREFFSGQRHQFELVLDLHGGTPFQQAVCQALMQIPAGSTCAYRTIARAIGKPAAVRAVGAAVGRNPISVIVPCHRVVGADGALTGYAGGLPRKAQLLALETAGPAHAAAVPAPHRAAESRTIAA